jgi:8-oxo-dGTP diphosphatase
MDESEFLKTYNPDAFPRPSVAVDLVLMSVVDGRLAVLMTKRSEHPSKGHWALPGGFVGIQESLEEAAKRILAAKANMPNIWLEQLYTFGNPGRDPRMRIISVAYFALLPPVHFAEAIRADGELTLAEINVAWQGEAGGPVTTCSQDGRELMLAFDHAEILGHAVLRLRGKLDYTPISFAMLPDLFTLRQLQDVHEAILSIRMNKPAFRRRMLDKNWIEGTGERETGASFRPAELYRLKSRGNEK